LRAIIPVFFSYNEKRLIPVKTINIFIVKELTALFLFVAFTNFIVFSTYAKAFDYSFD